MSFLRNSIRNAKVLYKSNFFFVIFLLLLIFFVFLVFYLSPSKIVLYLGFQNTYIIIFLISLFASISTFTSSYYYLAIVTFCIGGVNSILISLIAGLGITIGDAIFYYIGYRGRDYVIKTRFHEKIVLLSKWLKTKPKWLVYVFTFIYVGIFPFPTDFLMLFFALGGYSFYRLLPVLLLANIFQVFLVCFFSLLF